MCLEKMKDYFKAKEENNSFEAHWKLCHKPNPVQSGSRWGWAGGGGGLILVNKVVLCYILILKVHCLSTIFTDTVT